MSIPIQTLLVDNSPYAYAYQLDNGVPIESWYDDDSDTELLKLLAFLKRIQVTHTHTHTHTHIHNHIHTHI
ncbi:hypothetical protein EON63_23680 [archaeon]|nr:MAG: hypothetical protein EON63_23680 [archaeon]